MSASLAIYHTLFRRLCHQVYVNVGKRNNHPVTHLLDYKFELAEGKRVIGRVVEQAGFSIIAQAYFDRQLQRFAPANGAEVQTARKIKELACVDFTFRMDYDAYEHEEKEDLQIKVVLNVRDGSAFNNWREVQVFDIKVPVGTVDYNWDLLAALEDTQVEEAMQKVYDFLAPYHYVKPPQIVRDSSWLATTIRRILPGTSRGR